MSDKEQMKQHMKELLKENLKVEFKSTSTMTSDTDRLVVSILFDGEKISESSVDMRMLPMWRD